MEVLGVLGGIHHRVAPRHNRGFLEGEGENAKARRGRGDSERFMGRPTLRADWVTRPYGADPGEGIRHQALGGKRGPAPEGRDAHESLCLLCASLPGSAYLRSVVVAQGSNHAARQGHGHGTRRDARATSESGSVKQSLGEAGYPAISLARSPGSWPSTSERIARYRTEDALAA